MRTVEHQPGDIRTVTDILQDIIGKIQDIVRSEVQLAKTEIREETGKAARASVLLAAGAVLALYGLGFLLSTAVHALSLIMAPWLASLIVTVGVFAIAGVLMVVGRSRMRLVHVKPEKTITTIREDVQWVKDQTK